MNKNSATSNFNIRKACYADIKEIVKLLATDHLGKNRECYNDPLPESYYEAFIDIDADKNNYLMVAESDGMIIGTGQLTILTHMTYQGGKRGQIEGVRIAQSHRGYGFGKLMIEWMINKAQELKCHMVQLAMDKNRGETIEFYRRLGFIDSHEGLKLHFKRSADADAK